MRESERALRAREPYESIPTHMALGNTAAKGNDRESKQGRGKGAADDEAIRPKGGNGPAVQAAWPGLREEEHFHTLPQAPHRLSNAT